MKSFGLYINSHCDYDAGFPLWSPFIRYPYDQKKEWRDISMVYRDRWEYHPLSFGSRHFGESIDSGSPGRLSQSTEAGAGKRQIFAIGNFVKGYWSLFMISSWTRFGLSQWMELLISSDRSLDRWKGFSKVYSFDLKSATDRWPLSLKTNLIRTLFGKSVGDCLDAIFSRSMKYPFFAQFEVSYSLE